MRIPKNIFETVKEHLEFLVYLNSKPIFTISEVTSKIKIGDSILYKKITFWEKEGLVKKRIKPGTLGGYQYQYSFTPKARKELRKFLTLLLDTLNVKDELINSLKQLDDDKKEEVFALIAKFFKSLEKV